MDIAGLLRFAYGPVDIWGEYLMVTMDETTGSGLMAMPTFILTDRIQLIARYDMWDPNGDVEDDGHSRMIAGANYFISKNAKGAPETQLQVNWERTTPEAEDLEPIDQFMIQLRWEFKSNPF